MSPSHYLTNVLLILAATQYCLALNGDSFTVNCNILTRHRSDPIISPSVTSDHVHVIIGGNAFAQSMSPNASLLSSGTTCDKKLDLSNYWQPLLYQRLGGDDGGFEAVPITGAAIYYQNRACDYDAEVLKQGKGTGCAKDDRTFKTEVSNAFPLGFRMIAGDRARRTYNDSDIAERAIHMRCDGQKAFPGFPTQKCSRLRMEVTMPSCWTGGEVAPADHVSHVSYPLDTFPADYAGGMCPPSHPKSLLSLFYEFEYDLSSITDQSAGRLVFANGDVTGYALHADFMNGWTDGEKMRGAYSTCKDGSTNAGCSLLVVGKENVKSDVELLTPPKDGEDDVGEGHPIVKLLGNHAVPS